jgi:hypothetical protein
MKERHDREPARLLPDTQELLREIHDLTGLPVDVQCQPALRGKARAVYIACDPTAERHRILYDPKYERFLDHLVAHECGHIVRVAAASPSDRALPVMTSAQRYEASLQLLPGIEDLLERGIIQPEYLDTLLPLWLSGTVYQLHNTPADIHIERWLHREFPGLRKIQAASLMSQAREAHQVLGPEIELCTPRLVWDASNAMNYALMKSAMDLFGPEEFVRPYEGTKAEAVGTELLAMVDSTPDTGLVGDRQLSERFAERLGLKGWLTWRRIDDLPAEHWHIWEKDHASPVITRDERDGRRP